MLTIRRSDQRGYANHGWLKSHHSFSFANYYDPMHMGFRSLRVINEDLIAGGMGFGTHPHRDMEIITYVTRGALEHKDSMGTREVILPGEVQHMSAGTGVAHSEYNPRDDEETHLFQIWIMPDRDGHKPRYGQKSFEEALQSKSLVLVASHTGREGSIPIHQDADMYISRLKNEGTLEFAIRPGRGVWIQVARGQIEVNGSLLETGDAISGNDPETLKILAKEDSELIIFDLE